MEIHIHAAFWEKEISWMIQVSVRPEEIIFNLLSRHPWLTYKGNKEGVLPNK